MEAWVIKRDDGKYLHTYYVYEDENYGFGELNEAKLFDCFELARELVKKLRSLYNVKSEIVKIRIEEVEEDE